MAYGIGRVAAIGQEVVEGFEAGDGLVLAEGAEQIGEFVLRNFEFLNCFRQRYEDGMPRSSPIAGFEFRLPLVEQRERIVTFFRFRYLSRPEFIQVIFFLLARSQTLVLKLNGPSLDVNSPI